MPEFNIKSLLTPVEISTFMPSPTIAPPSGLWVGETPGAIAASVPPASLAQTRTTAETSADLFSNIGNAFSGFYESGQMWALLIGLVLGYMIRSLTAY